MGTSTHGRTVLALAVACAACGGDDGSAGDDVPPGPDAAPICGPDVCTSGALCGAGTDGCGDAVDCGACDYLVEPVTAGWWPSIEAGADVQIALVAAVGDTHELQLWRRDLVDGWSGETVAVLAGAPRGRPDLAFDRDLTPWIVYADDQSQIRVATRKGVEWIVSEPLGVGTAVSITASGGEPVVAIGGVVGSTTGVFIVERADTTWTARPVGDPISGGAPRAVAIDAAADQLDVLWRDPGEQAIRWARGRGTVYAVETIDPAATAPADDAALSLAIGPLGRPHVAYGRGAGELVYAIREGEAWHARVVGAADGDTALAVAATGAVHVAAFGEVGLSMVDGLGGAWLGQPVADACSDGAVDLDLDALGTLHVASSCGTEVTYRSRSGAFPF